MPAVDVFREMWDPDPAFRAAEERDRPRLALSLNIDRLLSERSLSDEELAAAAGLTLRRMRQIKRGDANPMPEEVERTAAVLGVAASSLLVLPGGGTTMDLLDGPGRPADGAPDSEVSLRRAS